MADRRGPSGFTFTKEENEQLTRVGPGTPMGELFRQYWMPVLPVSFLQEPGGRPLRVRLLCEDLLLFRTRRGTVGLVGAYCSHRLAPLYFGRIEDDGVRCPYHGWKYAPSGKCLEMPNIPAEQQFCDAIRHPGYPCVEQGGIIWTYMGPATEPPPLPEFEFLMVPDEQRSYRVFHQECNYLQVLEGGIDPTHVMWLHSPYDLTDDIAKSHQPSQQVAANLSGVRTPLAIEVVDTAAGFMYGAKRPAGDGKSLWRVNQFIMPFYTMPPGSDLRGARAYVPIDDENSIKWQINWFPTREIMLGSKEQDRKNFPEEDYLPATHEPFSFIRPKATKANDYLINWEVHKSKRMGIAGVNLQDRCITENEGPTPILDRTKENLCSADYTTIKARRMLLGAARALREKGTPPPGVRDPKVYRVRATSMVLPDSQPWVEGVKKEVLIPESTAL
ncbi:MAG TPA: Rieske 2Fe-2S domain-containing protein [Candidatus Acidoferrales bacterium]|nr:Rieske 2Fe-2S domain-containing protein [Candidatus Acidoferrales bacterium]